MFKLSIITINYNTLRLTSQCIESIGKIYKKELNENVFEIIAVDNASKDQSGEELEKYESRIKNFKLIKSKENLGFGNGNNLGEANAKGKYILFLNSDTKIEDDGFNKMVEFMEKNPDAGILGGRLKNLDGSRQSSAGADYNLWNVFFLLLGFERFGFLRESPNAIKKVAWVSGACMMVRKDIFEKLGGFEKELFMYMEDVDLCFRAKQKGFLTYYYPNIALIHQERGSSNRTFAILNIYKGLLFFFKKHKSSAQYVFVKNLLMLKAYCLIVLGKLTGNDYLYKTYRQALKLF